MRQPVIFVILLILLVSGCTPQAPSNVFPIATTQPAVATTNPQGTATPTLLATPLPVTVTPTATSLPSPTSTPAPVAFDRSGFSQFGITRSVFPGIWDFLAERTYTTINNAFSPTGDRIAVSACFGSMSNTNLCETDESGFLILLDTGSGEVTGEIPIGRNWPGGVDFTPDGQYLLYSTNEYQVALWDLVVDKPGLTLFQEAASGPNYFPWVAAAPDGGSYAALIRRTLYVWDPQGALLQEISAVPLAFFPALDYSADGSRFVIGSAGGAGLSVFDTSDWSVVFQVELSGPAGAALSPDGRFLAGAYEFDGAVTVWDVDSGNKIIDLETGHRVSSLSFNPAGDLLVAGGPGNLDEQDGYSSIGTLFDTHTWLTLGALYSFADEGRIVFNRDGSRMAVIGGYGLSVWGEADSQLMAGFETLQRFQEALHQGDYAAAAQLFEVTESEADYLQKKGMKPADLAGSFEQLCDRQAIYCLPAKELVMMGYDYEQMVYLVRLSDTQGGVFRAPDGATIHYYYLTTSSDGQAC